MSQSKGSNRMKDYTLCLINYTLYLFNPIMNQHHKAYTQFLLLNKHGIE